MARSFNPSLDLRRRIADRDQYRCRYCRVEMRTLDQVRSWRPELDHVIPQVLGGSHDIENLVLACQPCNRRKRGRTPTAAGMALSS